MMPTFRSRKALIVALWSVSSLFAMRCMALAPTWIINGPFGKGGIATAVVSDPQSPGTVFLATENGVFESTDAGTTWTPLNKELTDLSIGMLVIEPAYRGAIYALAFSGELYRTKDRASWSPISDDLGGLRVSTITADISGIYIGTRNPGAVYRSPDRGNTWQPLGSLPDGGANNVYSVAVDGSIVFAATSVGVFRSEDSGATWVPSNEGLASGAATKITIDPHSPRFVWASSTLSAPGLSQSTDGGRHWVAVAGLPSTYVNDFVSSSASTKYVAFGPVYKSIDGGLSWVQAGNPRERDYGLTGPVVAIAVDTSRDGTLYAAMQFLVGGGVAKSSNGGASWERLEANARALYITSVTVDPRTPATVYACTEEGLYRSLDAAETWAFAGTGLPSPVRDLRVDSDAAGTLYAVGGAGGLFRSEDHGTTWLAITIGLADPLYVNTIVLDPVVPRTLYVGVWNSGVYRSSDGGDHWDAQLPSSSVLSLAIDPNRHQTIYAGSGEGEIYGSSNGGASWARLYSFPSEYQAVQFLAVDTSSTVLASWIYSGAGPPEAVPLGGMVRSTDGGASWTSANNGLPGPAGFPGPAASSLATDAAGRIYCSPRYGRLFRSLDHGNSWSQVDVGSFRPSWIVRSIVFDPTDPSRLFAAVWNFDTVGGVIRLTLGPERDSLTLCRTDGCPVRPPPRSVGLRPTD